MHGIPFDRITNDVVSDRYLWRADRKFYRQVGGGLSISIYLQAFV